MPTRRRRTRRTRGGSSAASRPAGITGLIGSAIPDQIENPIKKVLGAPAGLAGNLAGDIKDAVVGLPMGLITTVQHPGRAVENIGRSYWQTYSPFFTGDPLKGLQNLYDHPLAPILDVATVFTLGAAGAARGAGALSKAGNTSATVNKIAGLRDAKTVMRENPANIWDVAIERPLSRSAGRRLVQEGMLKYEGRLPQWYRRAGYQRAKLGDMARRSVTAQWIKGEGYLRAREVDKAVKNEDYAYFTRRFDPEMLPEVPGADYEAIRLQTEAIFQGAKAMEDITELGKRARSTVYAHMHANLMRHNADRAYDRATAEAYLAENSHLTLAKAPEYMDSTYHGALKVKANAHSRAARRNSSWRSRVFEPEAAKWEAVRQKNAELANSFSRIEDELREAGNDLQTLYADGWQVANPARTKNPKGTDQMTHESRRVDDAVARVKNLEALREQARAAQTKHADALEKLEHLRRQKEDRDFAVTRLNDELEGLKDRSAESFYANIGDNYDDFLKQIDNFGERATTRDFGQAATTPDGRYYLIPKHDAYNLAFEGGSSLRFIHKLIHKPTMAWKSAVIGYTPRTITNNAIGNWFLYASRELPSANGLYAISDAFRFRFGSKIDGEALFPKNHWIYRYFADEYADQFGVGNEMVKFGDTSWKRRAKVGPFYAVQAAIAERPLRVATIYKALRDMPEVQAMIREQRAKGYRGSKAVDRGIEKALAKRPDLRDEAAQSSRRLAGDYITMSEGEKFVRDIVPFYLWNRHILKTTGNMFAEQPVRLALASQLSELGIEETENLLGEIPEFLRGAIPLAALGFGDRTGRKNIMLTASLNPFATVGELAESVDAFVTGSGRRGAAVAQLNPFLVGGFESTFEVNALTGNPSPREGGIAGDVALRTLLNLPQVKLADALTAPDTQTTPAGNDYLYARDNRSPLSSFLGIPIRDVSSETASALAQKADDEETSSGRRRRRRRRA